MNVKPHHPLTELLGQLLFGIETIPPKYIKRAVNRAIKEAVLWHESEIKKLRDSYKNDKCIFDVFGD